MKMEDLVGTPLSVTGQLELPREFKEVKTFAVSGVGSSMSEKILAQQE